MAALGILLVVAVSRSRLRPLWMVAALFLCVVSGSRNAILGAFLALTGLLIARWRFRALAVPAIAAAAAVVLSFASSSSISGREIEGEGRFAAWTQSLSRLNDPFLWLFGKGPGTGTNAAVVLAGKDSVGGNAVSDSGVVMVTLGFGVLGVVMLVACLFTAVKRLHPEITLTLIPPIVVCTIVFNSPEVSPFNILAAAALGISWAHPLQRTDPADYLRLSDSAPEVPVKRHVTSKGVRI
ncbi:MULTISPECIES: hypothetical protein [unclassified Microbacterium]|uniref:hypothetical protein n=1 Tax=unclassified Microbacterium TaxID=2609290 RepID=UPI00214CFCC2|nr:MULTISPECIES: hypothetical protein [unclassified Microbacterium]MCR2808902.1 hypothetical protein [Microbacterium sp. zg.B185]WIM18679.1 hypothetical protein QNO12_13955 [Microbacterium sp. zg-B185]